MNKQALHFGWILWLVGFLAACGSSDSTAVPDTEAAKKDSVISENTAKEIKREPSKYDELLKKFKPISFDTLKVFYNYEDKHFSGKELTLKEAKIFPLGITENYLGELSGVYACYQFQIDSSTLGLIARTPSEYESSSIKLFLFDIKKDKLLTDYFELGQDIGDAGDYYHRVSWLIKTKKNEVHSFVYNYSSYNHEVDDTADHVLEEWRDYYLINCMSPKFDTLSKNQSHLKKRFKKILKAEE